MSLSLYLIQFNPYFQNTKVIANAIDTILLSSKAFLATQPQSNYFLTRTILLHKKSPFKAFHAVNYSYSTTIITK